LNLNIKDVVNSTEDFDRNMKTQVRDNIISSLSKVSVSDLSSISMWANVLPTVTGSLNELSPNSVVKF
jgi:hypothetical protein